MNKKKKIGLFGGSFDPPHLGHLMLAQDAYEFLELDEVWFIPAFQAPLKNKVSQITADERFHLVELMCSMDSRFRAIDIEIKNGGVNYSIDTVKQIRSEYPDCDFYFLLGADQMNQLKNWRNVEELSQLVQFVGFTRPGYPFGLNPEMVRMNVMTVESHEMLISSSEIRERIQNRLPVYMFLHPRVDEYISANQLYYTPDQLLNV